MIEKADLNLQSHYSKLNNVQLHYKLEGSGPLVVMLHGFPEFWWSWRYQIPALTKNYRVVVPDMRGYNLSEKPKNVNDYRIPILIEDIRQLILTLGEQEAYIVGHDWGCIVSWAFASEHPEMVKKLAIINMPHPREVNHAFTHLNFRQIMRSYYVFLFQIPWIPEKAITAPGFFKKLMNLANHGNKESIEEDAAIYTEAYSHPNTASATINYYRAAFRDFITGNSYQFKPIKPSVLILWGTKDHALGKELTYNTQQYCAGDFKILYDENSGHNPHQDNPQWVNENLLAFFGT
jgi:pimeloyl-ACP methyl ester carboxylesterase